MPSNRHLLPMGVMLALLMPCTAFAMGEPAGVAGAVSGAVGLVSPAKQIVTPVAVSSGDGIVLGDELSTGADSRLQVMLLDESAITLGPDAELTIDEFVFDPASTNVNALSASLAKGAFRLVTGAIARQNPEGTALALPNAVLTIRGTTVIGACAATCVVALGGTGDANNAGKRPSSVTLKSARNEVVLKRAGYFVEIDADGQISEPRELTAEIEQRFADLFVPMTTPGGGAGNFQPAPASIIGLSGQPTQEGSPLAVNQRTFEDADQLDGNDTFEATTNLPVSEINYASGAIGFAGGSGDGDYYVNYSLNLAARSFDGSLTIDHQDEGFITTLPLLADPFTQGLSLVESGSVPNALLSAAPNPDATFNFAYTISQSGIDTAFQYDQDGPLTAPPSTGTGVAPAVP
ncbi:MAG: FecR domain-containing protein [Rhodospirillaceae bacterium]|nr:FecR domain-containing protein [Rhodospirillaceae bacterium]